jgi:hypothetical protein
MARKSARRLTQERCAELGATITENGFGEVNIMAPTGHYWREAGVHELVHSPWDADTESQTWGHAWASLRGESTEPCAAETCPSWDAEANACGWWSEVRDA